MAETAQPAPESARTSRVAMICRSHGMGDAKCHSRPRDWSSSSRSRPSFCSTGSSQSSAAISSASSARTSHATRRSPGRCWQQHNGICDGLHATIMPRGAHWSDLRNSYACLTGGTVTPILNGRPWLEKPALYYWRAMGFFREFGVSDWSARLPSSSGALALIVLIYLHMRRFRPGWPSRRRAHHRFLPRHRRLRPRRLH